MRRRIEAVWFDLDDTLFDHTHSVCCGMDAVREAYPGFSGCSSQALAGHYNRVLNSLYTLYLSGEVDFDEMRRLKLERFYAAAGVKAKDELTQGEFHRVYDEAYRRRRRATPGCVEVLARLREIGIGLAILTNGKRAIQEEKLRTIGLEWMIPNLLTSEAAGAVKPERKIFEWALEQTRETAEGVLMVGDNLENDVEAPLLCGLKAALYAPGATERTIATSHGPAPVIREWGELFDSIDGAAA